MLFALITWLFAAVTEDDVIKQVMHSEATFLKKTYSHEKELPAPRVDYITLFNDISQMPEDIKRAVSENIYEKEFSAKGRNYHFEEYQLGESESYWLIIDATEIQAIEEVSNIMFWFLLGVTFLIMTIAVYIAWLLAFKTATPLTTLTHHVIKHQPGQKFNNEASSRLDEIGALSRSFETAYANISELLLREKNFTNDLSHELRTPITVLMNTLALADGEPILDNEKIVLNEVAKDLKSTVEVLLALARSENLTFETFNVVPILERSVLMLHQSNPEITFRVKLKVEHEMQVTGNSYLASLLFQNLVNNGFYHGSDGDMLIFNDGNTLIFENKLSKNKLSTYKGLGHGQYLVQRISNIMNWSVKVHEKTDLYRVEVKT